MQKITIIDYGINNLESIKMAFNSLGYKALLTSDPKELELSDKIILPGVGSFEKGMKELKKIKIIDSLEKAFINNKPILGICLGMQMLMERSEEFGTHKGLGFIKGDVKKLPEGEGNVKIRKIPNVGWNKLSINEKSSSIYKNIIMESYEKKFYFYFTHSFFAKPLENNNVLCTTNYNEFKFASVITCNNLIGCQFHPEKSGKSGLKLLQKFILKNA